MEILTAILLLVLMALPIVYLVVPTKRQRKIAKFIDELPGPPKLPLLGTSKDMFRMERKDLAKYLSDRALKYGPIYRTWLGSRPMVHLGRPEYFEKIFHSSVNITKSSIYRFVKPWLGDGLVLSTGAKWHKHRKLITPAFHFKILESFVEVFNEKASVLVDTLAKNEVGKPFDLYPYITRCTLDIICETAMGIELDSVPGSSEYVDAVYRISELAIQRVLRPWQQSDFIYYRTETGKSYLKTLEILHGFTSKVLADRKQTGPKVKEVNADEADLGKKARLAFLDLILDAAKDGAVLDDDEVRDEVDTFMFAGHDTTTTGLSWSLFLLGNHPDVQERVREEIEAVFPDDGNLTMQHLSELKYLERVVKESLRIFPSVPMVARQLIEDVNIEKYHIPAGVSVSLDFFDVHHNAEFFPDPFKFDPDRFLPENVKTRHPFSFVPFSAGPRNCIGQKFAMSEEKTLLAWILKNFRVKSLESQRDVKTYREIILRPQNGLQVVLERI